PLSAFALLVSRRTAPVSRGAAAVSRRTPVVSGSTRGGTARAGLVSGRSTEGGGSGAGVWGGAGRRTPPLSGFPLPVAPAPPVGRRNSIGCRNAVAIARPRRRAGAKRRCFAPESAAESSAEYPLDSATLLDSGTSRPTESTNSRSTTSPSTFWSYSRGGYWIGESALIGTGGSWSGGVTAAPPSVAASSGGGAGLPQPAAASPRAPVSASQLLMTPPRVASSTPR